MDQHEPTVLAPQRAPKKGLKLMTPEERRAYNAQMKARSRERKKLAVYVFTADEWRDEFRKQHPALQTELDEYAKQFAETVLSELQINSSHAIDACLDQVARTLLGLKSGWVRDVQAPAGELVSGAYFGDALGELIVGDTHRNGLERSQTFSAAYRELLKILDKEYGHENSKDALAIKAELNGTYSLPPEPEPPKAPEPPAPEPPKVPTGQQVLAEGRARLLESLQHQLPVDARKYLYGN
jgi:hypothetical protein